MNSARFCLFLSLLLSVFLTVGCGSPGDATKVSKELYKKILLEIKNTDTSKEVKLDDVLKKHNVKRGDYAAAALLYAKDEKFMAEINKMNTEASGIAGAAVKEGDEDKKVVATEGEDEEGGEEEEGE
ncbi:hypothetical protein ACFL35_11170 [Candidatus Riflebacteria bacterium]